MKDCLGRVAARVALERPAEGFGCWNVRAMARWSQAPPLPWPRQGRRIFTVCSITVLPELTIIIPKAVTVGFQSLCLGVVHRFLSALKTGTEPWNLQLGCKGGLVPTSSANLVG